MLWSFVRISSCKRSILPVFGCFLLLITSNNSTVVLCQTTQSHSNTPWPLSSSCLVSLLLCSLLPHFCSVARNLSRGHAAPAIDLRVVMMAERLPAPGSDPGARAGLRTAWIAIDFYLIQSFHLRSNHLPVHCEPIHGRDLLIHPPPPLLPSEEPNAITCHSTNRVNTSCCSRHYDKTYSLKANPRSETSGPHPPSET